MASQFSTSNDREESGEMIVSVTKEKEKALALPHMFGGSL
jgi:hypothetical protein